MIEFKGEINGASKKFLIKYLTLAQFLCSLIVSVLAFILIAVFALTVSSLAWVCLIPVSVLLVGSLIPPTKNAQKLFVPKCVFIDLTEGSVVQVCEKTERFHMLENVKCIIDYGEWYYFKFCYSDRDPYFVCQKNLLSQGTLEEFEILFQDKIIRKVQQ